jgi:glycosyltransferase involved in cell wall biosynthesis
MLRGLYCERPDVILSYTTWPNVGCGLVWRLSPAKVCIWGQRDIRLHGDAVERFAYRRSSAIICNAAHEADYLRRTLGKTSAPVYVIHNGIDMVPCQKTRAQWRAELGIGVETMVATMVANFRLGKDHVSLLYAWRRLLRMSLKGQSLPRLLLAGAHQESYESVHNLARDLDLLDSVVFPGQVQDVAGLLAASDIGVLATADEGLPNAVLEYMASGLPVMVTDIPGNREALGDEADDQLCHTGDVESLAQKLLALIQSPDLRSRLGQRNRQRALAEFSITKMCETMAGTVCDLLRAVPARA